MDLKQTLKTVKLYESTISMILGAIVIALAAFLVFSYFRNLKVGQTTDNALKNEVAQSETYKVQQGDTLWSIAQNYYNDGFSWAKIAEVNALDENSNIEVGMELTIPEVKVSPTQVSTEEITEVVSTTTEITVPEGNISANTYTVVKGDSLWKVAVRAYGDGYKWVEIANANKLVNPNIIYTGMELNLPR